MDRIEEKIDDLNKWRWKVIGGSMVLSFFGTIIFQIILEVFKQKVVR
jgi:hypothetical protein